jgi:hypothetical protein
MVLKHLQLSWKRAIYVALLALAMTVIFFRRAPSYPSNERISELVGCYSLGRNTIDISNGNVVHDGIRYKLGPIRYFKDIVGFESPGNISYDEHDQRLRFENSKADAAINVFFRESQGVPYISFFSVDQKREFRFVKAPCVSPNAQ